MKTKEELNALKEEVTALSKKLAELNEEELVQVTGGGVTFDLDHDPISIKIDKSKFSIVKVGNT